MTSRSSLRTFRNADICTFRLPSHTIVLGPDAAYNLIFRDDGARRPDQHHQKIECAAAELDRLPIDEQPAGARQHATLSKPNDRVAASVHLVLPKAPPLRVMHRLVRGSSRDQLLLHDASPPSDLMLRR
jgi:hypothetical protein